MADSADRMYLGLLVVRCQSGDELAFEELLRHYQPRLRYFVHKMLREIHAADDVLQDVWLDVYRGVSRLADPRAFRAWLYQIARHRVLRELRKRRQSIRPLETLDIPVENCDQAEFTKEDAGQVHAALDQLPREHREALLLRFIEEMSYEDIARVTGSPVGTVRSRIHYAKRALRRVIERSGLP
jgi:RNA polymerase sigma-70 factor (ECF subfamily)